MRLEIPHKVNQILLKACLKSQFLWVVYKLSPVKMGLWRLPTLFLHDTLQPEDGLCAFRDWNPWWRHVTTGDPYFRNGHGTISLNTIARGMNIHLPATFNVNYRGTRFWHVLTHPQISRKNTLETIGWFGGTPMTARRSKASWGRSDGDGDFGSRSSEDLEAATRLGPLWAVKSKGCWPL